jgi:hypothetical protein
MRQNIRKNAIVLKARLGDLSARLLSAGRLGKGALYHHRLLFNDGEQDARSAGDAGPGGGTGQSDRLEARVCRGNPRFNRGAALNDLKRHEEAIASYGKAIAQDATMERDVRDAVDEETVVDSCKSENSARTEDQREYIFPSPYSGHPFSPSTRKCIIQPTSSKPISIFGFANTMSKGHIRVARAAAKSR